MIWMIELSVQGDFSRKLYRITIYFMKNIYDYTLQEIAFRVFQRLGYQTRSEDHLSVLNFEHDFK